MHMKKIFIPILTIAALGIASCGNKTTTETAVAEASVETTCGGANCSALEGEWSLTAIAVADSTTYTPDENEGTTVTFLCDSTVSFNTNCNTVGGQYLVNGDSITLGYLFSTKMACPDMRAEELLSAVLPQVKTYSICGDSVATLKTDNENTYISLSRNCKGGCTAEQEQ